ncbi:MAG: glycosyltransferase family 4 protein [candidate division Zixibacteria bacterium]|nr:glycosyltransferase family 4 protein [candidate division Zixibacteria bacterium]
MSSSQDNRVIFPTESPEISGVREASHEKLAPLLITDCFENNSRDSVSSSQQLVTLFLDEQQTAGYLSLTPQIKRSPGRRGTIRYAIRSLTNTLISVPNFIRVMENYRIVMFIANNALTLLTCFLPLIILAKLFGKKVSLYYRSSDMEIEFERYGFLILPVCRLADRLLVSSSFETELFRRNEIRAEKLDLPVEIQSTDCRIITEVQPHMLVVENEPGTANLRSVIRAFSLVKRKYPRAELSIAINSSIISNINYSQTLDGLSGIRAIGYSSDSELRMLFDNVDIFVNAGVGAPRPELLAWAFDAGLPVITTDRCGTAEMIVDRESGLLIDVHNHNALADRVIDLIEHPELVATLSSRGRLQAEKRSWLGVRRHWYNHFRVLAE